MKPTVTENIKDTLRGLDPEIPYSEQAYQLVTGTGIHESINFTKREQMGGGPALGLFQMEPETFKYHLRYLTKKRTDILRKISLISGVVDFTPENLKTNDIFATCMCRVHYFRIPAPIPDTLEGQASYWKKYYNTYLGAGKVAQYIEHYINYMKG